MLKDRALEIIKSSNNIEVLYNNKPVWIESIKGNTVKVKDLNNNNIIEVPASQLQETGIVK
ncbi:MAG: H-type small acid-soluble spore protein [Caloramator sp.]|nr:H-type small acid-soluble spore protein [Caloramator sp.]